MSDSDLSRAEPAPAPDLTVQAKMTRLFQVWPMKNAELARRVNDMPDASISEGYISQLRNGSRKKLSAEVAGWIAAAFGVDPAYFGSNPKLVAKVERQLDRLLEIRALPNGAEVERLAQQSVQIAARTATLSAPNRALFQELVEAELRKRELQMGSE